MVEVFKTNLQNIDESVMMIQKLLDHFPESRINFDLEDCDKILRVEGLCISGEKIVSLLNTNGYRCEVLL